MKTQFGHNAQKLTPPTLHISNNFIFSRHLLFFNVIFIDFFAVHPSTLTVATPTFDKKSLKLEKKRRKNFVKLEKTGKIIK